MGVPIFDILGENATMPLSTSLLQLFANYIALDTSLADGKNYVVALDMLEPVLQRCGFSTTRIPIPVSIAHAENRINLIAKLTSPQPLAPTLIMYNHMDVVPASYPDAYKLVIKNGDAYGRGTSDHKGSTIALLDAFTKIDASKLRFNIIFLLTTDEETEQYQQLKYLEKYLNFDQSSTIFFDPDTFAGGISVAHPGVWEFIISAKGKSSHSAASHLGHNAIETLLELFPLLQSYKKSAEQQHSAIPSFPQNGVSQQVVSRCNVNMISGGSAGNVVPDTAEMVVDTRFIPEMDVQIERKKLLKKLDQAFANLRTSGVQLAVTDLTILDGYCSYHEEFDVLEKHLRAVSGEGGQYSVMGSTPLAQWAKELGVPHFGLGVARYESNMHGIDEHCSLQDIEVLSEVIVRFVTKD